MRAAVITFPGSNCDRDLAVGLELAGADVTRVWHKDSELPEGIDLVGIPGGFSYGDYLRCGAIAANSPICAAVKTHAEKGGYVFGVCNGFQVLTETRLLPGALMRNAGLKYICRTVGPSANCTSRWQLHGVQRRIGYARRRRSRCVSLYRQSKRIGSRYCGHYIRKRARLGHDAPSRARIA